MTRKWIAARIDQLDPATDYDEIWKLSAAYRPTDFIMNLVYAVTFPHFFVRELDALPLIDNGDGKILKNPFRRSDDTSWKMQVWWHHGSHHDKTRENVESINKIHSHYAQRFGESFSRNDTYVYTLCYEAAGMHRLMQRVGMAGMSEKEQLAAVKYWHQMSTIFRNAGTGEAITGFPDSFDGIMTFMDRWESEDVPKHDMGPPAARAIIQQFADRYFPKFSHSLVFAWVISLYPDHLIRAYELKRPSPLARKALRLFTAGFLWMGEKVIPDPKDTFTERRQVAHAAKRAAGASKTPDQQSEQAKVAGCPFHRFRAKPSASDAASPGTTQAKK